MSDGGFVVGTRRVFVGSGQISGGGMPTLSGRSLPVVCARCGPVADDVPLGAIRESRRRHEREAHQELARQRAKHELGLARIDQLLWPREAEPPG